jgi:hypothetical protein
MQGFWSLRAISIANSGISRKAAEMALLLDKNSGKIADFKAETV